MGTRGAAVDHLAGCDCSASRVGQFTLDGQPVYPGQTVQACGVEDLHVCSPQCAESWGIITPEVSACVTR